MLPIGWTLSEGQPLHLVHYEGLTGCLLAYHYVKDNPSFQALFLTMIGQLRFGPPLCRKICFVVERTSLGGSYLGSKILHIVQGTTFDQGLLFQELPLQSATKRQALSQVLLSKGLLDCLTLCWGCVLEPA